MKRFKESQAIVFMAITTMALAGCSKPVLDYRNAETPDGLIYAEGANEPFTGTVTHIPDAFLMGYEGVYSRIMAAAGTRYSISPALLCTVSARKGYVDGNASCYLPRTETKILEADFATGQLSGKFVYYNWDNPDQKVIEARFDGGQPDGTEKIYSASTGKLIKKIGWSRGKYDGDFTNYNGANSKVVLEGAFADGKYDGQWRQYTADGKHLILKFSYDHGLRTGIAEGFDPQTGKRTTLVDKWVDGKINGERKTWDKNGVLTSDDVYVDGNMVESKDVNSEATRDVDHLKSGINQALTGSVPVATPTSQPIIATGSTAVPATPPMTPTSLETCVRKWSEAHHQEAAKAGVDDVATMDQIGEWEEWCKAGKQTPTG